MVIPRAGRAGAQLRNEDQRTERGGEGGGYSQTDMAPSTPTSPQPGSANEGGDANGSGRGGGAEGMGGGEAPPARASKEAISTTSRQRVRAVYTGVRHVLVGLD